MSQIIKAYKRLLVRYPYGSQAVQTAFLMALGDGVSQLLVEEKRLGQYDIIRTAKFAGFGFFIAGPTLRAWYGVLDRYVKYSGVKGALAKVSCDQLLFAPCFLSFFIGSMGVLNGESGSEISTRLQRDYFDILLTNWKVWPPVQIVNFYFVPLQHRVAVAQIVAIFWNTYLAFITNKAL